MKTDFVIKDGILEEYKGPGGDVILPEGIIGIGDRAFTRNGKLKSIIIPEGVKSVGEYAFFYCSKLKNIEIPESLESIGNCAFYGCEELISIRIPDSVRCIGDNAFNSCKALISLAIPESVTSIGEATFSQCESLDSITLPHGLKEINNRVFSGCSNLSRIMIPENVGRIGDCAFEGCHSLKSITIPNNVTSIGEKSFSGCSGLNSVIIPGNITSIAKYAFSECGSLADITINEGVKHIGDGGFYGCENLININIPESVKTVEDYAFTGCAKLIDEKNMIIVGDVLFSYTGDDTEIVVPDGVKRIGSEAFHNRRQITSIIIPESVTSIGFKAFPDCPNLREVIISDNATDIDDEAFVGCEALADSDGMVIINHILFGYYGTKEEIKLPDGITRIGSNVLRNYWDSWKRTSTVTKVIIPDSVTTIGKRAFSYCDNLTEITIPDSVISIGLGSFNNCKVLDNIILPKKITSIDDWAFNNCISLTSVSIPEGVTAIGRNAFEGCSSLKSVILPRSLESIKENAFKDCSNLTDIFIPVGVTYIGDNAFESCKQLTGMKSPVAMGFKIAEKCEFALFMTDREEPTFLAFAAKADRDNLSDFAKEGSWETYDLELINNGPQYKYKLSTRLFGALGRLMVPVEISDENRELLINFLTKNVKKMISFAESINCPEAVQALFDCGIVNHQNETAVRKLIGSSMIPEIAYLAKTEVRSEEPAEENKRSVKKDAKSVSLNGEQKKRKAKISDQKKVELLETAVLENNTVDVKALFEEYGWFEFTARAIGLAMRFCGSEMVKLLLNYGASLSYSFTPVLKRKYECKVEINSREEIPVDYAWYVFPAYKVKDYNRKTVSDEERAAAVRVLFDKEPDNFQEILYYAILYDDQVIYDVIRELGVRRISEYKTDIVAGRVPNNRLDSYGRYYRNEYQDCVIGVYPSEVPEDKTVRALKRYLDCMEVNTISLFPSDFYEPDFNSPMISGKRFSKKFCSEIMFDFFVKHTNMVEKVKKWDLLFALVDLNNASGLQYALSEKWISKSKDIDTLLSYAQDKNAGSELIGYILEKQNKNALTSPKKKSIVEDLSLDENALSVAEIKKSWGFKKLEDGTIIITSYKGINTEVVIPAAIGKDTVTAIDPDTFSTKASRITESQKKVRKAITSVEFPGTIKTIPTHIFYDGYTGYYNNTKAPHANLRRIVINEGTEIIAPNAFEYCNGLQEIVLPESVLVIGDSAFDGCWSLTKINLPESITKLSNHMFARCGFDNFEIPNHIISFGNGVFNNCWNLKSIIMSDGVTEIPGNMCAMCKSLKQFTIPKSVVKIGTGAFSNSSLEEIIIPDSVTSIGSRAFADCKQLKKISLSETVQLEESAFTGCYSLANEKGQIVVNGILFGVNDPKGGITLSVEGAITPLVIGEEIKRIAISRNQLPEIVYKEHSESGTGINTEELAVGDEVCFGRFPQKDDYEMYPLKWRVIAKEDGKTLLITIQSIISLNHSNQELIQTGIWKDYPVRKMLNDGFYHTVFTEIEQEQIIMTTLDNPKNKAQHVDGGPQTKDRVFLLSFDEVEKYMPTVLNKRASATEYAHNQYYAKRDIGFWQLRTPGKDSWGSVAVSENGETYAMTGNHVGYSYLRPAIWIK